jgi:2-polyprenyl-3-methyl-5-hydroxy-6-metoxy-1,4-benzoquinol methylase
MLNAKLKTHCDFCNSSSVEEIYKPINTKRGVVVVFCNECGLFESISTQEYQSRPPGNFSCDADRSSLRVTKGLTFPNYLPILQKFCDFEKEYFILDIGSNRGTFTEWSVDNLKVKKITAVEPDASVTYSYNNLNNVDLIIDRYENVKLNLDFYNFVYCVHTLEHSKSAKDMLNKIFDELSLGGVLFLAIPNLNWSEDAVVEFFIDPHTFHFDKSTIDFFIKQTGFEVLFRNDHSFFESIFVLRKTEKTFIGCKIDKSFIRDNVSRIKNDFQEYQLYLKKNRDELQVTSREIFSLIQQGFQIIFWGGGCIFDAIQKFGNLTPNEQIVVVDKYLCDHLEKISGHNLYSPTEIPRLIRHPSVLFIASMDYKSQIMEEASIFNFDKIFCLGDEVNI